MHKATRLRALVLNVWSPDQQQHPDLTPDSPTQGLILTSLQGILRGFEFERLSFKAQRLPPADNTETSLLAPAHLGARCPSGQEEL